MAKREKLLAARRPRAGSQVDDSILLRSAESLGRLIGSLQRQLDGARHRLAATTRADGSATADGDGGRKKTATPRAKSNGARTSNARTAKRKTGKATARPVKRASTTKATSTGRKRR